MFYTIYQTTNLVNQKIYIGCHITNNPNDNYLGSGNAIKAAIRKYGSENFKKEILFICDNVEDMLQMEEELVNEEFIKRPDVYNIVVGGHNGFYYVNRYGLNNSVNQHLVVGQKCKANNEYKKWFGFRISYGLKSSSIAGKSFAGKKHSNETKMMIGAKTSISQKGEKNSQFGTCWITNGNENKKIKKESLDEWMQKGYYRGRNKS